VNVVPAWITDPDVIASIRDGHVEVPVEFHATPAPRLSPTAGFVNALRRLAIRRYSAHIDKLETNVIAAWQTNASLQKGRNFNA
jgi:hypothetical protein